MDAVIREGLEIAADVLARYLKSVVEDNSDEDVGFFSRADAMADAQEAYDDLRRLARGQDARYDLVMSGDLYAAWYQMRRVVHAVGVLSHPLLAGDDSSLDILDIGCGTGATAWAVAILERARAASGHVARRVRVIGLDGSPFMIATAVELWDHLASAFGEVEVDATFSTTSWRNFDPRTVDLLLEDPLLFGGYVLDHSDEESVTELAEDLSALIEANGVGRFALYGSIGKQRILARLMELIPAASLPSAGWKVSHGQIGRGFVPATGLRAVESARRLLLEATGVTARDVKGLVWTTEHETAFMYAQREGQAKFPVGRRPTIVLDRPQRIAATPDGRPAIVIGAAGSGKSEVLVRRVVATVEEAVRGASSRTAVSPRRILVTAFNKYMVDHLVRRVEEELAELPDPLRITYDWCDAHCGSCRHAPKDNGAVDCTLLVGNLSQGALVRFMNWDKVFTRLLGISPVNGGFNRPAYLGRALPDDQAALRAAGISDDFLEAEFLRVIYGQRVRTQQEYERVVRRGRRRERIPRELRPAVWRAIDPRSERNGVRGFTKVRYDGWSSAAAPTSSDLFDVVVVDEGQDFTEADYEILGRLIRPDGVVIVALDPAQSQQLGASFLIPGRLEVVGRSARRDWVKHELSKTHRLSISISTAIQPLAERVRSERGEMSALEPRKSSVIGARPIIVDVRDEQDMHQIATILRRYEGYFRPDFGETPITSLLCAGEHDWYRELDGLLTDLASSGGTRVTKDAVDKRYSYWNGEWKGLEFDAVVWLTDARLGRPQQMLDSTLEWVYTVVSRPRSLLIIGLTPDTDPMTRYAVSHLDPECVHFWETDWAPQVFAEWSEEEGVEVK